MSTTETKIDAILDAIRQTSQNVKPWPNKPCTPSKR